MGICVKVFFLNVFWPLSTCKDCFKSLKTERLKNSSVWITYVNCFCIYVGTMKTEMFCAPLFFFQFKKYRFNCTAQNNSRWVKNELWNRKNRLAWLTFYPVLSSPVVQLLFCHLPPKYAVYDTGRGPCFINGRAL